MVEIMKGSCPLMRLGVRQSNRETEEFDRVCRGGVMLNAKMIIREETIASLTQGDRSARNSDAGLHSYSDA
jgi:hypothetical protein